jgi:hypothetical protein
MNKACKAAASRLTGFIIKGKIHESINIFTIQYFAKNMMRNVPIGLSILLLAFTAVSCQKELSFENTPGNNKPVSLLGNWDFHELKVSVEAVSTFYLGDVPGKEVVTYSAVTQNNRGFLTVTANMMKATDLGYTVAAEVKLIKDAGGQIINEQYEHLDFERPPGSSSCNYQQVGSDSLYFPNGFIFDIPDTNGQPFDGTSDPAGARFRITGDTLIIQSSISRSATATQDGREYVMSRKANGTSIFIRQ